MANGMARLKPSSLRVARGPSYENGDHLLRCRPDRSLMFDSQRGWQGCRPPRVSSAARHKSTGRAGLRQIRPPQSL